MGAARAADGRGGGGPVNTDLAPEVRALLEAIRDSADAPAVAPAHPGRLDQLGRLHTEQAAYISTAVTTALCAGVPGARVATAVLRDRIAALEAARGDGTGSAEGGGR